MTWAHHATQLGNHTSGFQGLAITIVLGVYFTVLQGIEYMEAPFRIADGSYGRTFFLATGFHGVHVIIGSTFILVCLFRLH